MNSTFGMRGRTVGAFFNICVCCLFFFVFSAGHWRSPEVSGGLSIQLEVAYWRLQRGSCAELHQIFRCHMFCCFDCLLLLLLLLLIIFFFLLFLDIFLGAPEVTGGIRIVSDSTEGAVFCEALSPP